MNFLIKTYDWLKVHTRLLWMSMVALAAVFVFCILHLKYSEDITDFLPLGTSEQEALSVYQNISGADRIYILFSNPDDPDYTIEAIEHFTGCVQEKDSLGWCADLTARVDMSQIQQVTDFIYDNIPYFLTPADFVRMDSLLVQPDYVARRLENDRRMLMLPTGGMMVSSIIRDPLGLFTPVLSSLQDSNPQMNFEMYDGYIFTPDMSRAVAMMSSPFGNSETEFNSRILDILHESVKDMENEYPEVSARVVGGPEIAVGNSTRIKKDSILAITLSVILIVLLVVYSIGSIRNILLIFLSIGWGWLFAMAGMSLFSSNVSIIVIGISSVILGIAVNYPLHLIVHISHVPDMRQAVKDIMAPLIIGNITTVGAFLTLVPLQSAALRDLGIFAAFLLVGTIIFVLLYLPHLVKVKHVAQTRNRLLDKISEFSPEKYKLLVGGVVCLTVFLAFFSVRTEFDTNIANINYMTDAQRDDMQYFEDLLSSSSSPDMTKVYVLSAGKDYDQALVGNSSVVPVIDSLCAGGLVSGYRGVSRFLVSKQEQQSRLDMWTEFVDRHSAALPGAVRANASKCGFSTNAFDGFLSLFESSKDLHPEDIGHFSVLTDLILSQNVTCVEATGQAYVVNVLDVPVDNMDDVKKCFPKSFDVAGMNSALSKNLSDDFNYIGWACSLIVFFFLWFSFGHIELAIIAFLPMAVSWIWILGIMAIFGIKFNIVNVILATFIFGQGDDYTIFMTEGCQYEYRFRRPIIASYKSSIIQSALIMFVGIGTLIVSKHPAMKSLAEVTIIGMVSVVLMAYMIPPLFFRWITMKGGVARKYPLTLRSLFGRVPQAPEDQVYARYMYKGSEITREVRRSLRQYAGDLKTLKPEGVYEIEDEGYGERAIFIALLNPDVKVVARIADDDRRRIAEVSAEDFVDNIEFIE